MPVDNSIISGDRRPLAGVPYLYKLLVPHEKVRWEVWHGVKCEDANSTGLFNFQTPSLGEGFVVRACYTRKETQGIEIYANLAVKVHPGTPKFGLIAWVDSNLQDIGNKRISYLDDVYLTVQTVNIVPGDRLSAKIMEKEQYIKANRPAGRTLSAEVDENGIVRFKVSAELLKQFAEKLNSEDWFNDITHQYYAEISYFGAEIPDENQVIIYDPKNPPLEIKPVIQVVAKSQTLNVANTGGQAVPPENGIKPVFIEKEKVVNTGKKPVELKLNFFFDGTQNNRNNIDIAKRYKAGEAVGDDEAIYKKYGKEESAENSYNLEYSNIAILQLCDAADKNKKEISIYIEGVGTLNSEGDSKFLGQGLDLRTTNIVYKVERAINLLLQEKENININKEKEYVSKVKVNVFGFSRGAAAARRFVSRERSRIALLTSTSKVNVIFTFVGLFDTVAAHGLPTLDDYTHHKFDTFELSLDMGSKPLKVLQLKAQNEYRRNFCLTNINSSIKAGVGYELALPGAHSDIGGGFKKIEEEKVSSSQNGLVDKLIEGGWYTKVQKNVIPAYTQYIPNTEGGTYIYFPARDSAERKIGNEYQYIPMKIMENFAVKYGAMTFIAEKIKMFYSKIPQELESIRDKFVLEADSKDGVHSVKVSELSKEDRDKLRNMYLHLTSFREGGQTGITDWFVNMGRYEKGELKRKILEG